MNPILLRHMDLIGEAGTAVPMHCHEWGHLLLVTGGAVSIATGSGQWLIAPSRSVWVPPCVEHRLSIHRRATLRLLYLNPGCCSNLPTTSRVIKVSALLRELMSEAIRRAPIDNNSSDNNSSDNNSSDNNTGSVLLCDLLVDQTRDCALSGIELLMPLDSRARTVAQRIQDPACLARPLDDLIADSGASRRTIERLFSEETGTSLAQWRQRWRMNVAATQLLSGVPVADVAQALGYGSVNSFSTAFREQHGTTPAKFAR